MARSARTQRSANSQFGSSAYSACEQQPGRVRTNDYQHEHDSREEHHDSGAHIVPKHGVNIWFDNAVGLQDESLGRGGVLSAHGIHPEHRA
jgi:hypothetical protein